MMSEWQDFQNAEVVDGNVKLRAPYTFVPMGENVLKAPNTADHARPLSDGVSGTLKLTWTNETPLLVGGLEDNADPCKNPDGDWMIPGASLRGMVRAVLESAGFARPLFIDDFAGHCRDTEDVTWKNTMKGSQQMQAQGGWLFRTDEGYRLVVADRTERPTFSQVFGWLGGGITNSDWHLKPLNERITLMQGAGKWGLVAASNFTPGATGGAQLVVSGPTAEPGRSGPTEKAHEVLLIWPDDPEVINIDEKTGDHFVASQHKDDTHPERANFTALTVTGGIDGFMAEKPAPFANQTANPARYALPVFWRNRGVGDRGDAQRTPNRDCILSLTAFLRVPYKNSVQDILACASKADGDALDLVQALFGWVPPESPEADSPGTRTPQERALASRVKFGFARAASGGHRPLPEVAWAATRPRPSFFPYYLRPKPTGNPIHPVDYDNPAAIIAGRKRYPARNGTAQLPGVTSNQETGEDRNKMVSKVRFLPAGITFTSTVRLHNLSQIELGALLWALTFGQTEADQGYRHMLGRAKSYGYGQMRVKLMTDDCRLQPVGPKGKTGIPEAIEKFKEWVCKGLPVDDFDGTETIRRLLNAAHAETGKALTACLHFPHTGGNPNDAESVLKGYTAIRKAVGKRGANFPNRLGETPAARRPDETGFVGLPPYPRRPDPAP